MPTLVEELREDARSGMAYHELSDRAADEIERLRAALQQAVHYADVASLEDGMPEGKAATRLTATFIGHEIRYSAEFDVKTARALAFCNEQQARPTD